MISPSQRHLEPGTLVAANYRVVKRLSDGGFGTVYLAENVTLAQHVVVKLLRGGHAGASHEEAQVLATLQHPNVVTVFAFDPALDCIVMEYLDGSSLSTLVDKGVDRINALRICLAIADALAAVHRRGLVHRDIKPENVMLALNPGGGRLVDWLKLIDFGLALKVGKRPSMLMGTPEYCGPEMFRGEQTAHPGNDIYALGVTLFSMLTGVFPFTGTAQELPRIHAEQPAPSLLTTLEEAPGAQPLEPRTRALLEDLDELVAQMLEKSVEARPEAAEIARRLTRLESSFADAGTYVGNPISSPRLPRVQERSGTGVLGHDGPTPQAQRRASTSSTTTPALDPVAMHVATDPITDRVRTLPARRTKSGSDVRRKFADDLDRTEKSDALPAPIAAPPADKITTDAHLAFSRPDAITNVGSPPTSNTRWLIPLLVLVVLALIAALALIEPRRATTPVPTPSPKAVEPPAPAPEPTPEPTPSPAPEPPSEPEPKTELTPGPTEIAPPSPTEPTPTPAAVGKKAPKPCVMDSARREQIRTEYFARYTDNPDVARFREPLFSAVKSGDCRGADSAMKQIRALPKR